MKKILIFIIAFLAMGCQQKAMAQTVYYWSGGVKNYLETDKSQTLIRFKEAPAAKLFLNNWNTNHKMNTAKEMYIGGLPSIVFSSNIAEFKGRTIISSLPESYVVSSSVDYITPVYKIGDKPIYVTNEIILQVKPNQPIEYILDKFSAYQLMVIEKTVSGMYLLKVNEVTKVFSIANEIHESNFVQWCHPNFKADITLTSDTYAPYQYYHTNSLNGAPDLNTPEAWLLSNKTCASAPVRVAVIDDGIDFSHPDLARTVDRGHTPLVRDGFGQTLPQMSLDGTDLGHGVACAGIIGAIHDKNIGIKGVANNVTIIPVNFFAGVGITGFNIAAGIEWAYSANLVGVLPYLT
jgi:subtilisin family serine protease